MIELKTLDKTFQMIHASDHPYVKLTTKKFATFFENFRATA